MIILIKKRLRGLSVAEGVATDRSIMVCPVADGDTRLTTFATASAFAATRCGEVEVDGVTSYHEVHRSYLSWLKGYEFGRGEGEGAVGDCGDNPLQDGIVRSAYYLKAT